jgi:hypothetical protein
MTISKDRPDILTTRKINAEFKKLVEMFAEIENENKKKLVNSMIEEAAFLKIALSQAKAELVEEGLTTETKNASQRFVKAHPSTTIYQKYSAQYTQIINSLIGYLPEKAQETVSKLAGLRDE